MLRKINIFKNYLQNILIIILFKDVNLAMHTAVSCGRCDNGFMLLDLSR